MNEMRVRKIRGSLFWVIDELVTIRSPFPEVPPGTFWIGHAAATSHADAIAHADQCARTKAAAEPQGARRP